MTKPYYSDDLVTLWHGDARQLQSWSYSDVLLTDPPYGIGWTRGQTKRNSGQPSHAGIDNDQDTTVRDDILATWGNHRPWLMFGSLQAEFPASWKRMLVFQKPEITGVMASKLPWRRDWEPIFVGGKWPEQIPMLSAVIRTTETSAGGYKGYATSAGHAHAKPLDVLTRLLEACPDGVVADPFAGSGSTLIAARNLGREAVGVELDEAYCERAAIRLSQQPLFSIEGAQMSKQDDFESKTLLAVAQAFESLSQELDTIANAFETKSDMMMKYIRDEGDFITYYAEWIREGWDWDNSEVVEG